MSDARPPLFGSQRRTDVTPKNHLETSHQFFDRIAGDYWQQVRDLMQSWLDRIVDDRNYRDIRSRLRADDADHYSAFLELYLHELFLRAGYTVRAHPSVPGSPRHPDFLVEADGESFYVEATVPGPRRAALGRSNRRAAFLDTIQGCSNRDFFLSIDRLDVGPTPAQGRRVRREIEQWLGSLDPDSIRCDADKRERFQWADAGWNVHLSAIPILPEHRGRPDHRAIGVYADGDVEWVDHAPTVRAALDAKANAYGRTDRPLVVALGTHILDRKRWHITNALYGRGAVTWREISNGQFVTIETRRPDGYFGTPAGWTNTSIAGVLHVNQLQPHHIHGAELTLWPHPGAVEPVANLSTRVPLATVAPIDGELVATVSAIDPSQHFGLPDPWPKGDAFPD